jgi:hypothetical protein
MRKACLSAAVAAGALLFAVNTTVRAADAAPAAPVTITGEAKCAKCSMHKSENCQTVIETSDNSGKTTDYYLVDNAVAKSFHEDICKQAKKATATGTVADHDGKKEFVATKIDLVK